MMLNLIDQITEINFDCVINAVLRGPEIFKDPEHSEIIQYLPR